MKSDKSYILFIEKKVANVIQVMKQNGYYIYEFWK